MATIASRAVTIYRKFAAIPLVFLGIGVQRAWSSLLFDTSLFPHADTSAYALGLFFTALVNFALAFFSTRLTPLHCRTTLIVASVITAIIGSLLIVCDTVFFGTGILTYVGSSLALAATCIPMLLWCEFFSMLNPTRVALIYSAAILFGAVISYLLSEMNPEIIWLLVIIMPIANAVWAVDSISRVADRHVEADTPKKPLVSYPVKPVILMAAVSFASGFIGIADSGTNLGVFAGTIVMPCIIIAVIFSGSDKIQLNSIYRLAMPAITIAMIALLPTNAFSNFAGLALFNGGETTLAIMTMIIFSNISYRYGTNVLRLNGIERGFRYLAFTVAWVLQAFLTPLFNSEQYNIANIVVAVLTVVLFSVIFLSNHDLFSRWGVRLINGADESEADNVALRAIVCENLGTAYQLTAREQEVLILLAQKKSPLQIEKSLIIAQGTLKAHINHIYTKLGIHTRNELYDLLQNKEIDYVNTLKKSD